MMQLEQLTVGYGDKCLIEGASAVIKPGRLTALIGRNGAGKSSLLRVLCGIDAPKSGSVSLDGQDLRSLSQPARARVISFVTTQRVRISNLRCRDVVGMGRAPYTDWIGRLTENDKDIVQRSMEMVDMQGYAERMLHTLSDGECQRIMIARALAQQTPVILLDEPTSFLDVPNRYETCRLLQRLAKDENKMIIFSTHELDIALNLCDDIMLIDSPKLLFGSTKEIVESGAIERLFHVKEYGKKYAE